MRTTGRSTMHDGKSRTGAGTGEGGKPTLCAVLKRYAPIAAIVLAMGVVWQTGAYRLLSAEALFRHHDTLNDMVTDNLAISVLGYMVLYVVTVALSLPGAVILTIAGGFLFGWAIAGTATVVAATLGAALIFLAARTALGDMLKARAGPFLAKLRDGFAEDAFHFLLFLRLVPVFPFWLVNLAPAFLGVTLRTFIAATLIGIIPGTFAFSCFGAGLRSVIEAQADAYGACLAAHPDGTGCNAAIDTSSLITPQLIGAFVALGIVALIPVVVKKLRKRRSGAHD